MLLWGAFLASSAHASVCPDSVPCLLCVIVYAVRDSYTCLPSSLWLQ